MSFDKMRKHWNALSFQLTIRYAALFTLSMLVTLSTVYWVIHETFMREMDENLAEEVQEMVLMMNSGGVQKAKEYMILEVDTEDEDIYYRLSGPDGQVLAMESNHDWWNFEEARHLFPVENFDSPAIETVRLKGYPARVRVIRSLIGASERLEIGKSLAEIDGYLLVFRSLMLLIGIPLIGVSSLIGWRLARHALKGVEEVTRTAGEISGGAFDKRVPVKQRPDEIALMAETFNAMVDRLQAVMKSMGEMSDNIAHDLRSPLARIRGVAEMALMKSATREDYEEMAVNTIEECDDLIVLINTMLDITELEAGAGEVRVEPVDLLHLVSEACELFGPLARERGIRVILDPEPGTLNMRTDKGKLQRLVFNLLENAIKYTLPGGEVTVRVQTDDKLIRIIFEDTGIGISETDLPRIFDRFYRCDRSRSYSGIGLGLSLAKAIVTVLGGDISASSTENAGSTFIITLPA